jgi:hypothetical protein
LTMRRVHDSGRQSLMVIPHLTILERALTALSTIDLIGDSVYSTYAYL